MYCAFSASKWLYFFIFFYISATIYGHNVWAWKESLLTPTRGEFYAHGECLTEWFRKKEVSFTFQLFPIMNLAFWIYLLFFKQISEITPVHPHHIPQQSFYSDGAVLNSSLLHGQLNSHMGGCDNVALGPWHTWTNNTAARQVSHAGDES